MKPAPHDAAPEDISRLIEQRRFEEAYDASLAMATAGVTSAQMTLGWLYQVGKGVPQDFERAKYWYREAARSNSARAEFYLGTAYWNQSEFSEALHWFEKAAARSFGPALYHLARMYRHGVGVARNPTLAGEYVEAAAQVGHVFARRDLAREMASGRAGVWRIPLGLAKLVGLGWITFTTASRNLEDDLLFRL